MKCACYTMQGGSQHAEPGTSAPHAAPAVGALATRSLSLLHGLQPPRPWLANSMYPVCLSEPMFVSLLLWQGCCCASVVMLPRVFCLLLTLLYVASARDTCFEVYNTECDCFRHIASRMLGSICWSGICCSATISCGLSRTYRS